MRWRTLGAAVVVGALAGCAPRALTQPRQGQVKAIDVYATLAADGTVAETLHVEFVSSRGGVVPVPRPLLGSTDDVMVNGQAATGPVDFDTMNIPVTGSSATATFTLSGVTNVYADGVTIELPVFAEPSDGSRQDPPIDVTGRLNLPETASGGIRLAQWNDGLHRQVTSTATAIVFAGKSPMWIDSALAIVLRAGAVAGNGSPGFGSAAAFESQQRTRESQNQDLERTLASQDAEREFAYGIVVAFSLFTAGASVWGFVKANRAGARERVRAAQAVPEYISEPPDNLDPALVSVLVGEGKTLDRAAVAGTVLDLAAGGALRIEQVGDSYTVERGAKPATQTEGERAVLAAIAARGPVVKGPPLFGPDDSGVWKTYRRDAFRRAKAQGLIERRFRVLYVGPFMTSIPVALWPFLDRRFFSVLPWLIVAGSLIVVIPLGGGYRLSRKAYTSLARWQAFARYVHDHAEVRDVGPGAVAIWGPYLAYATVLGGAPRAARELAPPGGREREHTGDIDKAVRP